MRGAGVEVPVREFGFEIILRKFAGPLNSYQLFTLPKLSSLILQWPFDLFPQFGCGLQGEVGVPQELPCQEDQVGLSLLQDSFCLAGFGDEAHSAGEDVCLGPNLFREPYLITFLYRDLGVGHQSA